MNTYMEQQKTVIRNTTISMPTKGFLYITQLLKGIECPTVLWLQ